jgi:hypothetical protein
MNELTYKVETVEEYDEDLGSSVEIEVASMSSNYKDSGGLPAEPLEPQIATEKEESAVRRDDPNSIKEIEKKINDPSELPVSVGKDLNPGAVVFDEETGAVKHDGLKPRVDLIPPEAIFAMGTMFRHGAEKYDDRNWEKGMKWSRVFGSTIRHLWAWWGGEDIDPDSKQPHLYSAACCVAMLIAYRERKAGTDDRWK